MSEKIDLLCDSLNRLANILIENKEQEFRIKTLENQLEDANHVLTKCQEIPNSVDRINYIARYKIRWDVK